MIIDKVEKYLREKGFTKEIMMAETSTATVDLAAEVLGVSPSRIAKSLSFKLKDGSCVVVVSQGRGRVDNRKFKDFFKYKPKMLKSDEVLECIGHPVGGVCPFALKEGVKIYLDVNLQEFETVFPAAGTANSMIEVSPQELLRITEGQWVDVCVS